MSLRRYTIPVGTDKWFVSGESETVFNWDYDSGRDRLLALYEKGKAKQWNAATLIDKVQRAFEDMGVVGSLGLVASPLTTALAALVAERSQ